VDEIRSRERLKRNTKEGKTKSPTVKKDARTMYLSKLHSKSKTNDDDMSPRQARVMEAIKIHNFGIDEPENSYRPN